MNLHCFNDRSEEHINKLQRMLLDSPDDIGLLTSLAKAYMETRKFALAQPLLEHAIELDPEGKEGKFGAQRYFWLGTVINGHGGVNLFRKGYALARNRLASIDQATTPKKYKKALMQLSQAYLSEGDIWLSELQTDPQAHTECERLINLALGLTKQNADAWIMHATLRIRQKRFSDARESIYTCWKLHQESLKEDICDRLGLFRLVQLAECMVETELYELVLDVTRTICYFNDQIPMAYYLKAYSHWKLLNETTTPGSDRTDLKDLSIIRSKHIIRGKEAAEVILEATGTIEQSLKSATQELFDSFPLPEIADPFDDEDEEKQSNDEIEEGDNLNVHQNYFPDLPSASEEESDST